MKVWLVKDGGAAAGRWGVVLLLGSAALVGLAIGSDGALARLVNGMGAAGWVAALVLLVGSVWGTDRRLATAAMTMAAVLGLAILVRPRDLALAAGTFFGAGVVVALVARDRRMWWTMLVPAAWLPVHVLVNVARSTMAGADRVRTDPPPTAALVPLTMVAAAAVGGLVVVRLDRGRRHDGGRPIVRAAGD